jgi:hypothetical protein
LMKKRRRRVSKCRSVKAEVLAPRDIKSYSRRYPKAILTILGDALVVNSVEGGRKAITRLFDHKVNLDIGAYFEFPLIVTTINIKRVLQTF